MRPIDDAGRHGRWSRLRLGASMNGHCGETDERLHPLQALGPLAPADLSGPALERYLGHYGLAPLLAERVGLYVGYLQAGDFRLWTQVWSPEAPIGTAFVVHGYFDHLGLYRHLLECLLDRGWRVVLWDLPGHGLSSGRRASIDDFEDYGRCLHHLQQHLADEGLAPRPWLGVGQSTGAAILATDALTRGDDGHWSGLALLAPLVRPWGWNQSSWLHRLVGPFVESIPRKFRANSTDAAFADFLREGDPCRPTAWRWTGSAPCAAGCRGCWRCRRARYRR